MIGMKAQPWLAGSLFFESDTTPSGLRTRRCGMNSFVKHLQKCRSSELRRTLARLLDDSDSDMRKLEELSPRKLKHRTHLFIDIGNSSIRHFRMWKAAAAQNQLLRSFAVDLKKGYCPFIAEEHSESFPFYMYVYRKDSTDLLSVCSRVHQIVTCLSHIPEPQQCYCFAEKSSAGWSSVRMHWPIMAVTELEAARLDQLRVHRAVDLRIPLQRDP